MSGARPKVIVFDFDGTLVDSVGIKDKAVRTVFAHEAAYLPAIMEYHLAHNHVVRDDKFRHITERILNRPYTQETRSALLAQFSALVRDAIVRAPEIDGATDCLRVCADRARPYLVSMTPDAELRDIVGARGMGGWFIDVIGASRSKSAAIEEILARENAGPRDAVMVGDSPEDFTAARSVGIGFIGRDSGKTFPVDAGPVHADMHGVRNALLDFIGIPA